MDDTTNTHRHLDDEPEPRPTVPVTPPAVGPVQARQDRDGDAAGDDHLIEYLKVVYKRRWLAMTAFVVVVAATAVYTFTATPIYEAKVRLLIEAEGLKVVSFQSVVDDQQARDDYYTTQYNVLQSRSLARMTLDSLKLWNTQPFGGTEKPAGFSVGRALSSTAASIKGLWSAKPPTVPGADETAAQSRAIDELLGRLQVVPIRNSRLVDISYRLPDPAMATAIANSIADNYILQNREFKLGASQDATSWLRNQLKDQKAQVETAERALQAYREANGAISLTNSENIVVQKLTQLNTEVTKAKTERINQEAMYVQLQQAQKDQALLDTFPAILTNAYIQQQKSVLAGLQREAAQLAETYGEKNEKMIAIKSKVADAQAKLDVEIQKVVQSVKTEYQAAVARERDLVHSLDDQKAEALKMNAKAIDYNVLLREAESSKQMYDTLMQRAKETGVSGALDSLKTDNLRIVDRAEKPQSPASPQTVLNLAVGIFGGAFLAIGLVFLFDRMDDRLKTPDEISHYLGLPHLGLLPLVSKSDESAGYPLLGKSVPANFAEAFRIIRTNVLFSSAGSGGQSVLVTSTGPGEGKSLVAANLAISLAQTGKRVLLIDADMRKPMVHQLFDMVQEPGLSNYLVGTVKASEMVRKSFVEGLWLCGAGRLPPNPSELLGSDRCTTLLKSLRQHFDWLVVDSPPIMAVADSSVISHAVSGVLFVVGADMTSRHAAARAIEQLDSTQAKFFGAVLNRADIEHNAYYYRQYYRRDYATYYQGNTKVS